MTGFVALLAVGVLFVLWRVRRHRRQERLAGLSFGAPTFMVTPPRQRAHKLDREAL